MSRITKEEVVETICREFGITPEILKMRTRREPLPTVRAFIAHFLYRELGMFPRDILPLTGHPIEKRTAVYHYLGRKTLVERTIPYDREMRLKMESIHSKLMSEIEMAAYRVTE